MNIYCNKLSLTFPHVLRKSKSSWDKTSAKYPDRVILVTVPSSYPNRVILVLNPELVLKSCDARTQIVQQVMHTRAARAKSLLDTKLDLYTKEYYIIFR